MRSSAFARSHTCCVSWSSGNQSRWSGHYSDFCLGWGSETVDGVRELELIGVETGPQRALWNELMAREHPRGAGPLVGC